MAKASNDAIALAPVRRKDERKFEHTENGNTASVHSVSERIRTVEEALAHGKIDTAVWEVERVTINSWEVAGKVQRKGEWGFETITLWQVKAFLRRKVAKPLEDACADLFARFKAHRPIAPKPPKRKGEKHLLEFSPCDAHFGKLAWAAETGEDFDTKIAERVFLNATEDVLSRTASTPIERVLFVFGNDFLHVNSWRLETAKGTPQDHDGRAAKVYEAAAMSVVHSIDRFLTVAPVDVLLVMGNHDPETSYFLAHFLWGWYQSNPNVTFDRSPKSRKAYRYGTNLIGFTHGDEERHDMLPGLLATEFPDLWAATKVREWHLGHWHKKKEIKHTDVDEHLGVRVRVLPSLSGKDAWHYRKGFHSRRCAEAYIWDKNDGYAGHVSVNARDR